MKEQPQNSNAWLTHTPTHTRTRILKDAHLCDDGLVSFSKLWRNALDLFQAL